MNNLSWIRALSTVSKIYSSLRLDGEDSLKRMEADKILAIVTQQMAKELEEFKKANSEAPVGKDVDLGGGVVVHNVLGV